MQKGGRGEKTTKGRRTSGENANNYDENNSQELEVMAASYELERKMYLSLGGKRLW